MPHAPTDGVTMHWLMEDRIQADAGLSLARMTVEPGKTSEAHRHSNCTEAIHVLSGQIEQRCDDRWTELLSGETILIPVGSLHQTRNIGTVPAVMIVAYSSGARIYEAESAS